MAVEIIDNPHKTYVFPDQQPMEDTDIVQIYLPSDGAADWGLCFTSDLKPGMIWRWAPSTHPHINIQLLAEQRRSGIDTCPSCHSDLTDVQGYPQTRDCANMLCRAYYP